MLNIEDIRKKLTDEPIPSEVLEIRQRITNYFQNLEFIEDGHKYYLHNEDGSTDEMESVSNVCHKFQPEVDWDTIAERKALKIGVDSKILKREWFEKNKKSTSNGSLTHLFAEAMMYFCMDEIDSMSNIIKKMQFENGYLIPYGNKQEAVSKFYEDLLSVHNFYPVMPEAKIYIKAGDNPYGIKYNIAGTFDALFAFKDKNGNYKLAIFDWKTNENLKNDYNWKNHNTLLEPFKNMTDEPLSIYTLQLNLYQLGLQQAIDCDIIDRRLVWLKNDGTYEKISIPDISNKLVEALSV